MFTSCHHLRLPFLLYSLIFTHIDSYGKLCWTLHREFLLGLVRLHGCSVASQLLCSYSVLICLVIIYVFHFSSIVTHYNTCRFLWKALSDSTLGVTSWVLQYYMVAKKLHSNYAFTLCLRPVIIYIFHFSSSHSKLHM